MARRKSEIKIPGIDDRPMTKERLDAMWERLSTQEEVFFGVGRRGQAGADDKAPSVIKPVRKTRVCHGKLQADLSDTHALG